MDEILDNEEMQTLGNISPAWKEPQSRESMIIRKMRNRIVKKIPKDFSNAYIQQVVDDIEDDFQTRQLNRKEVEIIEEIEQNANSEVLDPIPPVEEKKPSNVTNDGEIIDGDFSEGEPTDEASDPY